MRSYDQYCSLARALDIIGDRWTLLVIRELLVRPCRYAELQAGLPGIATNLLAERLRQLEDAGVVSRDAQGRYQLTEWGQQLAVPVRELARWGARLMERKADADAFRGQWFALPAAMMFGGTEPGRPDVTVEIRAGGETASLRPQSVSWYRPCGSRPTTPVSSSSRSRSASRLVAIPGRPACRSAYRQGRTSSSRTTSSVQRSPTMSRALAREQYWS